MVRNISDAKEIERIRDIRYLRNFRFQGSIGLNIIVMMATLFAVMFYLFKRSFGPTAVIWPSFSVCLPLLGMPCSSRYGFTCCSMCGFCCCLIMFSWVWFTVFLNFYFVVWIFFMHVFVNLFMYVWVHPFLFVCCSFFWVSKIPFNNAISRIKHTGLWNMSGDGMYNSNIICTDGQVSLFM